MTHQARILLNQMCETSVQLGTLMAHGSDHSFLFHRLRTLMDKFMECAPQNVKRQTIEDSMVRNAYVAYMHEAGALPLENVAETWLKLGS